MSHMFYQFCSFYSVIVFLIFLCLFSGRISVYDYVRVLNCMSCCHYGVIKHNNINYYYYYYEANRGRNQ